jgi:cytochrome c oxidase accessory protein FixG
MSSRKAFLRMAKHAAWVLLALWTGFTFVGYFTPVKTLWSSVFSFSLGPWEMFWILFYGAFTYTFAGHLREQVCKYMCPYARFQGVMFDPDTLTITYDETRGEPRGAHKRGEDYKAAGKGDCVDCGICVQVCPTGIDIRKGLQYECIGCAACIDACDQVMEKMGTPKGLIRYSTEHAIASHWGWRTIVRHIIRPRVLVYSAVLGVIVVAFIWGIVTKSTLRVDVIRDRAVLAREVDNGMIENIYRLHLMNVSEHARQYQITVRGLPGIQLIGQTALELSTEADKTLMVQVQVPPESGKKGAHEIHFDFKDVSGETPLVSEEAKFFLP